MNIFASTLLLSHISPNDFLDLDAASRLHYFGPLIGRIRMVSIWCKTNLEAAFTLVLSGAARAKLTASLKGGRTYSQIFRPSSRQMTILSTWQWTKGASSMTIQPTPPGSVTKVRINDRYNVPAERMKDSGGVAPLTQIA